MYICIYSIHEPLTRILLSLLGNTVNSACTDADLYILSRPVNS